MSSKFTRQTTIGQFEAMFPDDDACKAYLASRRWPDGAVKRPRCGTEKVSKLVARPFHWQCHQCLARGYRFSVTVDTIFANSNVKLRQWFRVIHMMLTGIKGIAALEVQRVMRFGSYRTAHYVCMRVRGR